MYIIEAGCAIRKIERKRETGECVAPRGWDGREVRLHSDNVGTELEKKIN